MDWCSITDSAAAEGVLNYPPLVNESTVASPSVANTPSVSLFLTDWHRLTKDGWEAFDPKDWLIQDLIYGNVVVKSGDTYYCGSDEAYKRLSNKKRGWLWRAIEQMIACCPTEDEQSLLNRISQTFPGACVTRRMPERGGWLSLVFDQLLGSMK